MILLLLPQAKPKQQLYEIYTRVFIWEQKKGKPSCCWLCNEGGRKWVPNPKTNTKKLRRCWHPSPYPECCGRHLPLLSQTHPDAPDSAQAVPPLARPPSATGEQKENGIHVTNSLQNVVIPILLYWMNKVNNLPLMVYSMLSHPNTSFEVWSDPEAKKGQASLSLTLDWSLREQGKIQGYIFNWVTY